MMRRHVLIAAPLAAALAAGVSAQRFKAGVELVSLNVSVSDGSKFITDLEEHEFEVFEDGAKQTVSFFSRRQLPIALAILLDTSNSMEDKLPTAQEAAIGFSRRLRPEDVITVIGFSSQVRILQPFTNEAPLL